jgi:uncharacterized membrane protein YdjX (TVP38/TMEM64 family)
VTPERAPSPPHLPRRPNLLETDRTTAHTARRIWLTLAIVAALAATWWSGQEAAPYLLTLVSDIRGLGPAAPMAFILIYSIAVALLIPASLLTVAAGAVFGFTGGVIYSIIASTLGSVLAFLLGRYLARDLVARWLAATPRYAAIEQAVSARGRRIVFLLRLSPVTPFNVLNYVLGLTTISLTDFVVASAGMLPGTIVYSYFGKVTGEALVLAGQAQMPHNTSYYAALLAGLVATVAVTAVVTRTARRALRDV